MQQEAGTHRVQTNLYAIIFMFCITLARILQQES